MSSFGKIIKEIQVREKFSSRNDMAKALHIFPAALSMYTTGNRNTPDYVVLRLSEMQCVKDEGIDLKTMLVIRDFYYENKQAINTVRESLRCQFVNGRKEIDVEPLIVAIRDAIIKSTNHSPRRYSYNAESVEKATLLITAQEVIGTIFVQHPAN